MMFKGKTILPLYSRIEKKIKEIKEGITKKNNE